PIQVYSEDGIAEVSFEAEHFSTYTVIFTKEEATLNTLKLHVMQYNGGDITEGPTEDITVDLSSGEVDVADLLHGRILTGYLFSKVTAENQFNTSSVAKIELGDNDAITAVFEDGSAQIVNDLYAWYVADSKIVVSVQLGDGNLQQIAI